MESPAPLFRQTRLSAASRVPPRLSAAEATWPTSFRMMEQVDPETATITCPIRATSILIQSHQTSHVLQIQLSCSILHHISCFCYITYQVQGHTVNVFFQLSHPNQSQNLSMGHTGAFHLSRIHSANDTMLYRQQLNLPRHLDLSNARYMPCRAPACINSAAQYRATRLYGLRCRRRHREGNAVQRKSHHDRIYTTHQCERAARVCMSQRTVMA